MRHFEMVGRCQCCKPEVILNDPSKFWRYPLKQQKGHTLRGVLYTGFTKEWIEIQTEIANTSWLQSAEVAISKVEKKLERTSKERLFVYFDSMPFVFKSIKQTCCLAYEYFTEHEDTVCVKTIDGYVNLYLLKNKHLTFEEFYDKNHN
jgi:hypothetical protein